MDINPQTADFSEHGKQVRVMRGDVSQFDDVMNALNIAKPSRVINLAYFLGSDYPPRVAFKLNILGMDNCFEACRLAGVNRIAYTSSLAVSGEHKFYGDRRINEGDFRHGHVQYAMHKIVTNGRCRTTAKSTAWRSRQSARPTSPDLTRLSARLTTSSASRHQYAETRSASRSGTRRAVRSTSTRWRKSSPASS